LHIVKLRREFTIEGLATTGRAGERAALYSAYALSFLRESGKLQLAREEARRHRAAAGTCYGQAV
jgi:hypothetical protein